MSQLEVRPRAAQSPAGPQLPMGWAWASLGEVAELVRNGVSKAPREASGVAVLRISAVRPMNLDVDDVRFLPEPKSDYATFVVEAGDLLFTRYNGNPALVGVCAVVPPAGAGLVHPDKLIRVVLPENIDPRYVAGTVAVGSPREFIDRRSRSTAGQTGISGGDLKRVPLPLAPPAEQERVADALDSYLSRLDDAVATLERVQRNLKRYRASVLKAAVEGRLVPTEAELAREEARDYEPADVLLERILEERKARWIENAAEKARARAEKKAMKAGKPWSDADNQAAREKGRKAAAKKYEEPEAPDTSALPELPEGWCWTQVDQFLATGLSNGRSVPTADTGFPVLRLTALKGPKIDLAERKTGGWTREDAEPHLVSAGDILVARGNGSIRLVGWGGLVGPDPDEVAFPDTMIRIRLIPDNITPEFFVAIWNSRMVRDQLERRARTTAGIYKVNQAILESIVFPLPPLLEQRRLVAEIDRHDTIVDATVRSSEVNELRAGRLRQSILKWAFEGRLVDQDPNDEPASVLLDRIAAEREKAQAKNRKKKRRRKARKKTTA